MTTNQESVVSVSTTASQLARAFGIVIRQVADLLLMLQDYHALAPNLPHVLDISNQEVIDLQFYLESHLKPTWDWLIRVMDSTEAQLRFGSILSSSTNPSHPSHPMHANYVRNLRETNREEAVLRGGTLHPLEAGQRRIVRTGVTGGGGGGVSGGGGAGGSGGVAAGGGSSSGASDGNSARRDFLTYALSLMRSHNSEHADSLPATDVSALKHVAYVLDALVYYMRSGGGGADGEADTLRDSASVQSWQDPDDNINDDGDDPVNQSVTMETDSIDGDSDTGGGAIKSGRRHPFFQRSDSTMFLGCAPPDPFEVPLVEALPLADQPHLLNPYSRKEDLFGMPRQTVSAHNLPADLLIEGGGPSSMGGGPSHVPGLHELWPFDRLPTHMALSARASASGSVQPTSHHTFVNPQMSVGGVGSGGVVGGYHGPAMMHPSQTEQHNTAGHQLFSGPTPGGSGGVGGGGVGGESSRAMSNVAVDMTSSFTSSGVIVRPLVTTTTTTPLLSASPSFSFSLAHPAPSTYDTDTLIEQRQAMDSLMRSIAGTPYVARASGGVAAVDEGLVAGFSSGSGRVGGGEEVELSLIPLPRFYQAEQLTTTTTTSYDDTPSDLSMDTQSSHMMDQATPPPHPNHQSAGSLSGSAEQGVEGGASLRSPAKYAICSLLQDQQVQLQQLQQQPQQLQQLPHLQQPQLQQQLLQQPQQLQQHSVIVHASSTSSSSSLAHSSSFYPAPHPPTPTATVGGMLPLLTAAHTGSDLSTETGAGSAASLEPLPLPPPPSYEDLRMFGEMGLDLTNPSKNNHPSSSSNTRTSTTTTTVDSSVITSVTYDMITHLYIYTSSMLYIHTLIYIYTLALC